MVILDPIYYVALPLLTAFLLPLFGKLYKPLIGIIPGLVFLFLAYMSVMLMIEVTPEDPIITKIAGWNPPFGINLVFSSFSGFIASLISIMAFLIWGYSYNFKKVGFDDSLKYFILLMLVVTGTIGIVLTGDIFNLFVFLEITAISSYALTAIYRGRDGAEAAFKFLLIGAFASSMILLAIILLYSQVGTLNMAEIAVRMPEVDFNIKILIFILFFVGFGIEAEMFPLNGWVPDAYSQAPGPIAAVFAGMVAKAGIYALIRVIYLMFDLEGAFGLLLIMGLITMIVAEVVALRQEKLRRMLAYSSIGQMGLIMIAFSINTEQGVFAAIFLMFNHALIKSLLFLTTSFLVYNSKSKLISDLDGFGKKMPLVSLLFGLGAFALVGLPPFSGFWSKLYVLIAAADQHMELIIALILSVSVVEIIYYFKVISRLYFRKASEEIPIQKPSINSSVVMIIMGSLIVLVGVYPDLITGLIENATTSLMNKGIYIEKVLPGLAEIIN